MYILVLCMNWPLDDIDSEADTGHTRRTRPTHPQCSARGPAKQKAHVRFLPRDGGVGTAPLPPSKDKRQAVRGMGVSQISEALATFVQHKRPPLELMGVRGSGSTLSTASQWRGCRAGLNAAATINSDC
ncbi:hypothetical protein SKAU_G00202460 [Synaphobranchus kaupii]|uniref:Uncharacterized protein n=1 Tax=Synaphobranchus kaupii TaxID=118154 RepID=A0A9Q1FG28_SYNKA|nr:hypothetical protein SKAU_G00202460 [Synaphobranchus kaupii]